MVGIQSLKLLTEEDMAVMHIFLGHRPLLVDTSDARNGAWPDGAPAFYELAQN